MMTEVMEKKGREEVYIRRARERLEAEGAGEPDWLKDARRAAIERFERLGFPSRRHEDWRSTNVAPLLETEFLPAESTTAVAAEVLERYTYWESSSARLVFVDGRFREDLSSRRDLPEGTRVESLSAVLGGRVPAVPGLEEAWSSVEDDAFEALNAALAADGAVVHVPAGGRVEGPVHLLFLSSSHERPTIAHPRNFILAGENAELTVVERYAPVESCAGYFNNAVTEVRAGQNSRIDLVKIQRESEFAYHLGLMSVVQDRASSFRSTCISVGALLSRSAVRTEQAGEGTSTELNGLYVVDGRRHADNQIVVNHARSRGTSHQFYKGILSDRATGVFNGKIVADAQTVGTDAHQTNKNLLLSDEAFVDTRPQLEINADDIKCSHGATIGALDPQALFYLRSRGIPEDKAKSLLTYAFASDVIERIRIEPIRLRIREFLASRTVWGRTSPEDDS